MTLSACDNAYVQEFQHIGSKYNRSARPFLGSQQTAGAAQPVAMQYNSPVNLYSTDAATDAYSAQSAALHAGMQRSAFFYEIGIIKHHNFNPVLS